MANGDTIRQYKAGVITVEHVTRLTCQCGVTLEVPTKVRHGETESFGTPYSELSYDWPREWGFTATDGCANRTKKAQEARELAAKLANQDRV